MERDASATATSGGKAAGWRAEDRALDALDNKLDTELDIIPCPRCGWVQADMVRWAKRTHWRGLRNAGIAVTAIAVLFGVPFRFAEQSISRPSDSAFPWTTFLLCAAIGPGLIILRLALAALHDPNSGSREALRALAEERAIPADELDEIHAEEEERKHGEKEPSLPLDEILRRQIRRWRRRGG